MLLIDELIQIIQIIISINCRCALVIKKKKKLVEYGNLTIIILITDHNLNCFKCDILF